MKVKLTPSEKDLIRSLANSAADSLRHAKVEYQKDNRGTLCGNRGNFVYGLYMGYRLAAHRAFVHCQAVRMHEGGGQ